MNPYLAASQRLFRRPLVFRGDSISPPVKPVNSQAKFLAGRSLTLLLEWWVVALRRPARESGRNESDVTYSGFTAQPDCTALRA